MQNNNIAVDIHGVVMSHYVPWTERNFIDTGKLVLPSQITRWDTTDVQLSLDSLTDWVIMRARPMPLARYAIGRLLEAGYRLTFVSAPHTPSVTAATARWMQLYFGEFTPLVFTAEKWAVENWDELIDDGVHNRPTILFDATHNQGTRHRRAYGWRDVLEQLTGEKVRASVLSKLILMDYHARYSQNRELLLDPFSGIFPGERSEVLHALDEIAKDNRDVEINRLYSSTVYSGTDSRGSNTFGHIIQKEVTIGERTFGASPVAQH